LLPADDSYPSYSGTYISTIPIGYTFLGVEKGIQSIAMGRKRSKYHNLPPRMHKKGRSYYYVTSTSGKRKWIKLSADYSEALAKWAELEGSKPSGETIEQAIDRYLVEALPLNAEKTQMEYSRQAGKIRKMWGGRRLDEVRPMHIAQYLDQHPHKVTANREVSLLSSIYSFAMRWGWCDHNPCRGVRRHSEKPRERYIEDFELAVLREVASDQFRCIIDLAYLTAMRKSDLLKLNLSNIREDGLYVQQGKTGKRQIFKLTPGLQALLNRIRRLRRRVGTLSLFATRQGQPYTESGFDSIWRRLIKRSGVKDIHFHDIRAKSITDAKGLGGLDYAQALAGHESRDTTEGYVKSRETERVLPLGRKL
jgi:integrase